MNKQNISDSIKKLREISPKRKFVQSFDLIINLKNINIKKPEEKIDLFITLPYERGKKQRICAFIDQTLAAQAKECCDKIILKEEFPIYKKKQIKKLASDYDYFIAQANLMPQIATTFGRVLGPRQKMPNPKAGCVVPPTATLKPVCDKLHKTVNATTKNEAVVRLLIGKENMKDEEIEENITTVYNAVIHKLPQEKNNVKSLLLKLTMGPSVEMTDKGPVVREKIKVKEPKKTKPKE